MNNLYLCFGADGGARSETLLRAAGMLAHQLGARSVSCSSMYADKHRQLPSGATVNMVVRVDNVSASDEIIRSVIQGIENELGRVRDPDRQLPVLIDIDWIGTLRQGNIEWDAHYDIGRNYIWLGLFELGDSQIQADLERLCLEREFSENDVAKGFYPLMTSEYTSALVSKAMGSATDWLAYKAA